MKTLLFTLLLSLAPIGAKQAYSAQPLDAVTCTQKLIRNLLAKQGVVAPIQFRENHALSQTEFANEKGIYEVVLRGQARLAGYDGRDHELSYVAATTWYSGTYSHDRKAPAAYAPQTPYVATTYGEPHCAWMNLTEIHTYYTEQWAPVMVYDRTDRHMVIALPEHQSHRQVEGYLSRAGTNFWIESLLSTASSEN